MDKQNMLQNIMEKGRAFSNKRTEVLMMQHEPFLKKSRQGTGS